MPTPIIMLPCSCKNGHPFTRREAQRLDFVCDKDGEAIVCEAPLDLSPLTPTPKPPPQ